jgi:hypothetical protein
MVTMKEEFKVLKNFAFTLLVAQQNFIFDA